MANTYAQLYVHLVFVLKGRSNLISIKWRDSLYKYITGITSNKKQKLMIINGMPDHIHMLIGYKPDCNLSDLARDIKANSSKFINDNKWIRGKFEWQARFGAFSVGHSQVQMVINYILKQEEHHQVKKFNEEYIDMLNENQVEFKTEYIL